MPTQFSSRVLPPWISGYKRNWLTADAIAGVTLAAVAIPEAMGYTKIAGMPVITGIYTVFLPPLLFALLGASRRLIVGADSATAAILFASASTVLVPGTPAYVAMVGEVAVVTGLMLLVARLIRLGFLADFLSRTALVGFLTGVGIQVAIGQLPDMLGISASGDFFSKVGDIAREVGSASGPTVAVAVVVVALMVLLEKFVKRVPAPLIVVAGAIIVSTLSDLSAHGVHVVGAVPGGIPGLTLPNLTEHTATVLGISASLFIVILAQTAATSRSFALRHDEDVDIERDLVGVAAANVVAGISGAFPVNGSPTKTAAAESAGEHTQLTQIVASVAAVLVLVLATGLLHNLPEPALAGIVFVIGLRLVDGAQLSALWRLRKDEFALAALTALVVVCIGVEQGIILAVVLSMLDYVRRGYRPHDAVIMPGDGGSHMIPKAAKPGMETLPGIIAYRFEAGLFFANAEYFTARMLLLIRSAPHPVKWIVLDLSAVSDIDYTAGQTLLHSLNAIEKLGAHLAVVHADDVRSLLDRYGIIKQIGIDRVYVGHREAMEALREE